jgi:hypothetical protein
MADDFGGDRNDSRLILTDKRADFAKVVDGKFIITSFGIINIPELIIIKTGEDLLKGIGSLRVEPFLSFGVNRLSSVEEKGVEGSVGLGLNCSVMSSRDMVDGVGSDGGVLGVVVVG